MDKACFLYFRDEGKEELSQEEEFEAPAQKERPERTESETSQWLQSLLLFAITWSFGGNLDGESRVKYVAKSFLFVILV